MCAIHLPPSQLAKAHWLWSENFANTPLNTTSFAQEIGGKSTVSMICNEKRKLTAEHIEKLASRFDISPALFF